MRVAAIRLFVPDVDAAAPFYAATLGLTELAVEPGAWAVYDGGGVHVVVEAVPADAGADDVALVGRFSGVSFAVEDIEAAHRRLLADDVPCEGAPQHQPWGGVLLTVCDPGGNRVQLVQYPT